MTTCYSRRAVLTATAAAVSSPFSLHHARAAGPTIQVGSISDLSGPYEDMSGPGTVNATKFAVADFTRDNPDLVVQTRSADFSLKTDTGLAILREWFDKGGVDAVNDFPTSPLALGSAQLVRDKNKVALMTAPATADLTGVACGPNHIHWTYDTYALASTVGHALLSQGLKTWFFISADYAMGRSMVTDLSRIITASGGRVVGVAAHPFPETTDFSSYLLQAQSSGAQVLCLANSGTNAVNCIKQAAEFGMLSKGLAIAAPLVEIPQIHEIGAETAQGMYTATSFYWDRNADSRAFAARLAPLNGGYMPNQNHAGAYAAVLHYLKAVKQLGPAAAKADGRAVVAAMKELPADDPLFGRSIVREDGRVVHDMYLLQAKKPSDMRGNWDYMRIAATVPGAEAFRPIGEGGCKMTRS